MMKMLGRRLIALLMAMMLLMGVAIPGALAQDDWRSILKDAFGLLEDFAESYEEYDDGEYDSYYDEDYGSKYDDPVTNPQQIVNYIDEFGCLPDNFITKNEAKDLGWDSSRNYVGDVVPGMSIGGDRFGNYEGLLPDKNGRKWYECDANYKGKKRGAERVVFSSDGLYYYTDDHYESFTQMFPEG